METGLDGLELTTVGLSLEKLEDGETEVLSLNLHFRFPERGDLEPVVFGVALTEGMSVNQVGQRLCDLVRLILGKLG